MLNKVTKSGWLFAVTFAILLPGCSTTPIESGGIAENNKDRPPKYVYAIELLKRNEYGKAQDVFLSLEHDYPHPDLYANMALIYINKKQHEKAKIYIEKSIKIDPGNDVTQNIYGVVLRNLGEFDKSLQAYNTSLSINPGNPHVHLNLGILHDIFLDSPKDALLNYEKYQQNVPDDKEVEKWIVEVKRRLK